ncbi:hypothetical protein PHMEG_00036122 [Phytophthora megakarya]|uniref:Uncharacterized protein n=1 Tax=Phytophthora megakarya TaxID=4795 RepID=A0A225UMN3_9STRA|nr:hypothetical protein PHMEG_00036122 [Phytophthora megakarya]
MDYESAVDLYLSMCYVLVLKTATGIILMNNRLLDPANVTCDFEINFHEQIWWDACFIGNTRFAKK